MPLIDTVLEVTVKQQKYNQLIVREKDGTEYLFDPGRGAYIENETLSIRVTGLDRNIGSGRPDELQGVVVASELKLPDGFRMPVDIIETGTWDPVYLYGPSAARDFFPDHYSRTWRMLAFSFTTPIPEADINMINDASEKLDGGAHAEAAEMLSEVLGRIPWMIDLHHVLGVLELSHNHAEKAGKYHQMAIKIAETVLPEADDYILDYRENSNAFYLSHLHSLADLSQRSGRREEALELFCKCYRLMPQDPACTRLALQQMTGKPYPQTDEQGIQFPVDPYLHYARYKDIPLHDGYDPDSKPDFAKWLGWEESYRRLLILHAHNEWFIANKFDDKSAFAHILMHDMVESTLAREESREMRLQMARAIANGMNRHDVIHDFGEAMIQNLVEARKRQEEAAGGNP